jgi:hypothetical protein
LGTSGEDDDNLDKTEAFATRKRKPVVALIRRDPESSLATFSAHSVLIHPGNGSSD